MAAISARLPAVAVEYESRGKRVTRKFADANKAKTFYIEKDQAGKKPTVAGREVDWSDIEAGNPTAEAPEEAAPAEPTKQPRPKLGVNPKAKTRAGAAGRVIAAHGLEHGVTDEMIAECGKLYGKPNPVEDGIVMRNGFHAVKAYLDAVRA